MRLGIAILIFLLTGCATYYRQNRKFQDHFTSGEYEKASEDLEKNKNLAKEKNKLLYLFEKGTVTMLMGRSEMSNNHFEEAYIFSQDYRKNYKDEIISLLTNPSTKPYIGEDHELVLIHYFKVLNYLKDSDLEKALVECRRINIRLNAMNDRYEHKKNRYKRDAFGMNLMGIIYEASGDVNNAFIAYRNAYNTYKEDYSEHFETPVPAQLKKDLLRTAYEMGFYEELEFYEKEFGMEYNVETKNEKELVMFWHNGLGPVKDEWSINFAIIRKQGGVVLFINEEYGLSFAFTLPSAASGENGLGDLKFIRVAFPKYKERKPFYTNAELILEGNHFALEKGEDINEIAIKTLEDRMIREFAVALLRLAIKQATEYQIRKENKGLGVVVSVLNALSEKADTRNWQTLPHSIHYSRVPLKPGKNEIQIEIFSPFKDRFIQENIIVDPGSKRTVFEVYHTFESTTPG